jgi:hypothetical protein
LDGALVPGSTHESAEQDLAAVQHAGVMDNFKERKRQTVAVSSLTKAMDFKRMYNKIHQTGKGAPGIKADTVAQNVMAIVSDHIALGNLSPTTRASRLITVLKYFHYNEKLLRADLLDDVHAMINFYIAQSVHGCEAMTIIANMPITKFDTLHSINYYMKLLKVDKTFVIQTIQGLFGMICSQTTSRQKMEVMTIASASFKMNRYKAESGRLYWDMECLYAAQKHRLFSKKTAKFLEGNTAEANAIALALLLLQSIGAIDSAQDVYVGIEILDTTKKTADYLTIDDVIEKCTHADNIVQSGLHGSVEADPKYRRRLYQELLKTDLGGKIELFCAVDHSGLILSHRMSLNPMTTLISGVMKPCGYLNSPKQVLGTTGTCKAWRGDTGNFDMIGEFDVSRSKIAGQDQRLGDNVYRMTEQEKMCFPANLASGSVDRKIVADYMKNHMDQIPLYAMGPTRFREGAAVYRDPLPPTPQFLKRYEVGLIPASREHFGKCHCMVQGCTFMVKFPGDVVEHIRNVHKPTTKGKSTIVICPACDGLVSLFSFFVHRSHSCEGDHSKNCLFQHLNAVGLV